MDNRNTCGNMRDWVAQGGTTGPNKTFCKRTDVRTAISNKQMMSYLAGQGCCDAPGATGGQALTQCDVVDKHDFQLCADDADYNPKLEVQLACNGVKEAKCKGEAEGAKFEWDASQGADACQVGAINATNDLNKACTSIGGFPSLTPTYCGLFVDYYVAAGVKADKVGCETGSKLSTNMTNAQMAAWLAGVRGCCKGGTVSKPKTRCADLDRDVTTAAPTAAPTTGVATKTVSVKVTLKHLSFDKIQADASVKAKLVDSVKQGFLDKLTGYTKSDLTVEFTKGSVVANVKITPKAGDITALKNTITAEKTNIAAAAVTKVKALPEMAQMVEAGKSLSDITATASAPIEVVQAGTTKVPSANSASASDVSMSAVMSSSVLALACLLTC